MAISVDLAKALDKDYEDKSLKDILDASPAALAGVTDADAAALAQAFNIKTVRQLGTNRFFAVAAVLAALEGTVNLSNPRAIFAGSPPQFTRSRVTYEAYVVSRTSTRPQVDSAAVRDHRSRGRVVA